MMMVHSFRMADFVCIAGQELASDLYVFASKLEEMNNIMTQERLPTYKLVLCDADNHDAPASADHTPHGQVHNRGKLYSVAGTGLAPEKLTASIYLAWRKQRRDTSLFPGGKAWKRSNLSYFEPRNDT